MFLEHIFKDSVKIKIDNYYNIIYNINNDELCKLSRLGTCCIEEKQRT